MTQNPYSQFGSPGSQQYGGDFIDPVPSRTSVLAIIGLVISLIGCIACVVPGPGAFAAIFGGLGLFFIARSSGRLTGSGIAITGIVLGLFQSVACIALWTGAAQALQWFNGHFFVPISNTMTSIEKGDVKNARSLFSPEASAVITDEMFKDFAQRYRAQVGGFQRTPQSMLEFGKSWVELVKTAKSSGQHHGPVIQPHGPDPQFPTPARFDNGLALVMIEMDVRHPDKKNSNGTPKILNINVTTLDGTEIWLIDPAELDKLLQSTQGSGGTPPPPPPPPAPGSPPSPTSPATSPGGTP